MKLSIFLILLTCSFLIPAFPGHAGDNFKIGVIDFQQILKDSKSGQEVQSKIKEQGAALKLELQKKQDEIKEMQAKYKRESLILTDEQKSIKERELRAELNEYRVLQNQNSQKFNQLRSELVNNVRNVIVDLAQKMGENKGYTLIIEKQSGTVLYAKDPLYITDQFVSEIDKQKDQAENIKP